MTIPRFEPEVIASKMRGKPSWHHEKVATTPLRNLRVQGVSLTSRYDKADELEEMTRMIQGLPMHLTGMVKSIFCDSKATYCYEVDLVIWCTLDDADAIGRNLTAASVGHNGIQMKAGDRTFEVYPYWDEG